MTMLTLFLGAGFSKWAMDLPLARQLFDFQIVPFGVKEATKLQRVIRLKSNWDCENPREPTEKFIADALTRPDINKELVLWYIVRRLSEPFIWKEYQGQRWRRHVLMIDEFRISKLTGIRQVQAFVNRCMNFGLGIITTNYDLLVEYALGTRGFNYGVLGQRLSGRGPYPLSQWNNPVTLRGTVSLAKLHGSISWDETSYYSDGRRGLTGNALIVAPTPEKTPPKSLAQVWALSADILKRTRHLIVFGFAFNMYDEAILNHLCEHGINIRQVLLVDIAPKPEIAEALWPHAGISTVLPPPEGQMEIDCWINTIHRP